jgi:hypothetical protein
VRKKLLREITDCRRRTVLPSERATFARLVTASSISRLRKGGRMTTDKLNRIRSFMNAHRDITMATRSIVIPTISGAKESKGTPQKLKKFGPNRNRVLLGPIATPGGSV